MSSLLSIRNLKKVFPGKMIRPAVDDISFDLKEGEILGLLGPNGSGKTTTIQMLLGTLSAASGEIFYFGKDFKTHRSELLRSISFASTYTSLPWLLTVDENLKVIGLLHGLNTAESKKRYEPLLERFGIMEKRNARISSLSAGQVTRLILVKAFFVGAKIILMDEPTAALDPDISKDIHEFILEQRAKDNLSILFTSHKMEEAAELCDRVIFLKNGKIISSGLPSELAKTISSLRLRLNISDGMKRSIALAEKYQLTYQVDHRSIEISIDEKSLPSFLGRLAKEEVIYTHINIVEPSLEDYFLHIARGAK